MADIEKVRNEILDILVIQSQIPPLEEKISRLSARLIEAESSVKAAEERKSESIDLKEQAEIDLSVAQKKYKDAQDALQVAKDIVKQAQESVGKTEEELSKYDEGLFEKHDLDIEDCEFVRSNIQVEIEENQRQLKAVKVDLLERQANLKDKGYELNLLPEKPRGRTTYL